MADDLRDDTADAPAVVLEAPVDSVESAGAAALPAVEPLPPLLPNEPSKQGRKRKPQRKGGKGRPRLYDSPEAAAAARRQRERERRQREKAQRAAEAAAGMPSPSASAPVSDPPAPALCDESAQQPAEPLPPDPQLAAMLGLGIDLAARYVPDEYGGGALSAEEREVLGGVWATALAPYLQGPTSALMVAAVTTVQVFAVRAISNQSKQIEPDKTEHKPAAPPANATQPPRDPAPPAKREAERAGTPKRKVKLPQYTDED